MNTAIVEVQRTFIENSIYKEKYCNCPLHQGTLVQQIEGNLCNGKPVAIMLDISGYHVVIGEAGEDLDLGYPPDAVPQSVMYQMIWEAVNSD